MSKIFLKFKVNPKSALISIVFVVLFFAGMAGGSLAKENDITASEVIKLVNKERKAAGLEALKENPKLEAAAKEKARDMLSKKYFAHISPEGISPWDLIMAQGYDYRLAGENLAIDYTDTKQQHKAWMESELHRKNILNPEYEEIGVAAMEGNIEGRKTIMTVQEFGVQMVATVQQSYVKKENILNQSAVAGISVATPAKELAAPNVGYTDFSKQIEPGKIFENNKLTFFGWLGVVVISIFITIFDTAFVIYKRRGHPWLPMK